MSGGSSAGNPNGGNPNAPLASLYTLTYLPLQPGCDSATIGGLSSNGIAAVNEVCSNGARAYVYDHGNITTLPDTVVAVSGINAHKVVITGGTPGTLYNVLTGQSMELADQGDPIAINDSSVAVGIYNDCVGNSLPCLGAAEFASNASLRLALVGFESTAINAKGDATSQGFGNFTLPDADSGAYLTTPSFSITDIGRLFGYTENSAAAWGLNSLDHVFVTHSSTAFLWTGGTHRVNVPLLPGDAQAVLGFVTDTDVVIGDSCDASEVTCRPFVSQNGETHLLTQDVPALRPVNSLGSNREPNLAVNGKGEILINALHNGQSVVAFLVPNGCINP